MSGCNGKRAHNDSNHSCDAPVAVACCSMYTLAGNTAASSAMSPHPAATRVAGNNTPIAPATSATPLNCTARRALGTHGGTMRKKKPGATKCSTPAPAKMIAMSTTDADGFTRAVR